MERLSTLGHLFVYIVFLDGMKRDHEEEEDVDYDQGRKRQRGEGNRIDLRILLQSKVSLFGSRVLMVEI